MLFGRNCVGLTKILTYLKEILIISFYIPKINSIEVGNWIYILGQ